MGKSHPTEKCMYTTFNMISEKEVREIEKKHLVYYNETVAKQQCMPIKTFEIRNSDIFLIGYPKAGTTWAQEMVWLIANDLDYEGAKVFIDERFPNIENIIFSSRKVNENVKRLECHYDSIEYAKKMPDPRFIKTHLSVEYLPEQLLSGETDAKIIYITRDVKDAFLSFYHFTKSLTKSYTGSFEDLMKVYMYGTFPKGHYWKNVLYFWQRRHEKNILFITYEQMKSDLRGVLKQIAAFLNKNLTEDQEDELIKWLDFETFKNNSAVNHENLYNKGGFVRVGKVGGYRKEMSAEMIYVFDEWSKEWIKDTDFELNVSTN